MANLNGTPAQLAYRAWQAVSACHRDAITLCGELLHELLDVNSRAGRLIPDRVLCSGYAAGTTKNGRSATGRHSLLTSCAPLPKTASRSPFTMTSRKTPESRCLPTKRSSSHSH